MTESRRILITGLSTYWGGRLAQALVQTISDDIRATIQEELLDMVGKRRSVWFG